MHDSVLSWQVDARKECHISSVDNRTALLNLLPEIDKDRLVLLSTVPSENTQVT